MSPSARGGFTLLEVMVAMSILAVGLTAVVMVFSRGAGAVSQVEGYERAGMEAEARLAEYLNGQVSPPDSKTGACENLPGGVWRITAAKDPDRSGVSVVTVTVSFRADGLERELTLETAQADLALPEQTKILNAGL
ncbi:MAG: prepilin-type N-terminal cleavage/methylation domain-containing protein [Desulfovibrionaceae bacterium]